MKITMRTVKDHSVAERYLSTRFEPRPYWGDFTRHDFEACRYVFQTRIPGLKAYVAVCILSFWLGGMWDTQETAGFQESNAACIEALLDLETPIIHDGKLINFFGESLARFELEEVAP